MEYQKQADNEPDFVLDNRKLVLIFFGLLAICGCFFILGYTLGSGAPSPPANYANAGVAGKSGINDNSGREAYDRMNEIVSEPIPPSSTVAKPSPAAVEAAVVVLNPEPPAVSLPPVSTDKTRSQSLETTNKAAAATTGKTASSTKQTASARGTFSVQVAAFRARSQAENKAMELEAKGFEYRIESPQTANDYYRVKVGRFASRAQADEMANRLRRSGFETMISENKGN